MHTTEYQRDEQDMDRPRQSVYIIVFWDGAYVRDKIKETTY
jgi:hypothetical protein